MKTNIVVVLCLSLSIAFLAIGIVAGYSINKTETIKEVEVTIVETIETQWSTKRSIYAVVEVDNDTLYYDKFVWVEDYHIYMPLSDLYQEETNMFRFYSGSIIDILDEHIFYRFGFNHTYIPGTSISKTEKVIQDRYIFRVYENRIKEDGFEWKDINSHNLISMNPDYLEND